MYKRVFIVDDDEVSIFLTEATLDFEAFAEEYQSFMSTKDAIDALLANIDGTSPQPLPEIVFLDLNMPLMSGWGLLDALAPYEQQIIDSTRIFILTSSLDAQEVKRAGKYKLVTDFLEKPLSDTTIQKLKKQAQ
ncbi:response regulator [Pontibacter sp. 172403-2]|uniref:response regulator n=1 Tax=Pontibacter rufus TaxID=2791028 RepID=UPI0018AF7444|nr:response regulator [Pontibacter sp. 172403-2]MBF9254584.1 response regulator [Pontibacter sp. 172403-2]